MQAKKSQRRVIFWAITACVLFNALGCPVSSAAVPLGSFDFAIPLVYCGAKLLVFGLLLFLAWYAARTTYRIDGGEVIRSSGGSLSKQISVSVDRIESIEINRGAEKYLLGIADLEIYSSGGILPDLTLHSLTYADARRLSKRICHLNRKCLI